jgi:acetate kinase
MKILVLNAGSSSQKSALFEVDAPVSREPVSPLWEGKLDWDGEHERLSIRNATRKEINEEKQTALGERPASLERMLQNLWSGPTAVLNSQDEIALVGHRIVHGGAKLTKPTLINAEVKRQIADLSAIAPLHNRVGLEGIELIEKLLPGRRQIAVFDTGFHRTLPLAAKVYAGPYEWYERGIQRYGFHGINHEYCANRAAQLLKRDLSMLKIVTCHLGNGCSLCAVDGGKSVNTTMGFTPLEGLMMGTRCGSIDPGIVTYLMRVENAGYYELDRMLNRQSGLLGISGVSSDMRDVLEAMRQGNDRAKLAFDIFVHRLVNEIGAMVASLGGIDALVFSAGIGEHSPEVRSEACGKLQFLGVKLDQDKNSNAKPDTEISTVHSSVRVLVIQAQEDWAIARECAQVTSDTRTRADLVGRLKDKVSINGDVEAPIEPPDAWESSR